MKIAVMGGAGYIGSTLLRFFFENDVDFVSIDNLTRGNYKHIRDIGIDGKNCLVQGDIRDYQLLEEVCNGSDAIAHLAAIPGLVLCNQDPEEAISVNIFGTDQVLEVARKLDIEKVVFCSSAAVYGKPIQLPVDEQHQSRPLNLYGVTKLAGEKLMEVYHDTYGIDTISLRFGNVFGVGLYTNYETVIPKFVKQAFDQEPLTIYGDGFSSRDFVHVEDIVQAISLALKSEGLGGDAFNVGGTTTDIGELAKSIIDAVEKRIGKKVEIHYLPSRPGETKEFSYNMNKIRKNLGYEPLWSVEKGIEQIFEYKMKQRKR